MQRDFQWWALLSSFYCEGRELKDARSNPLSSSSRRHRHIAGTPQLLSNISACSAISETLSTTLGPRGMDKLIVNDREKLRSQMMLLEIVHPAARTLVDIARAQDAEVGDGTTSVVLLATQMLKEIRGYIEEGVSPHIIMKGFRKATQLKIPGGGMQDSLLVQGVAFKKTFTYAGPSRTDYQAIVDAEWEIIYRKLQAIEKTGAKVWFADRDIFCAGRVPAGDLRRVIQLPAHLGTCGVFEEKQIGGERYNLFQNCPKAKTCTLILRGGAEQFIEEVEPSVRNGDVVAGGGAVEQQLIIAAFAKALEIIPRQICDNAAMAGVDVDGPSGVRDNMEAFVWEPSLAACLILSVDETVRNPQIFRLMQGPKLPRHGPRALRGRGRGCLDGS
ncbi:chaperonin Cpn60/TCP-1 family [Salix suchowensis]|nr:chaperonin Cpn60/TCP-1 family [Salix suchowensis]